MIAVLATPCFIGTGWAISSWAQEKTSTSKSCPSFEREFTPVISAVNEYWRLAEMGSISEVKKIRTDKWKGFEFKVVESGESY